jgi:hypothetical protein
MEIAKLVAKYEGRGFSRERAEINALMEGAVFTILLARGASLPSREEIINSLRRDLVPVAENLQLGGLRFEAEGPDAQEGRIFVATDSGQRLFRIDLTRFGSAIESEVEAHAIEGELGDSAVIRTATKELLLLQKAEAFLLRRHVKARDAYDIYLLRGIGATLNHQLQAHLEDALLANEIDSSGVLDRMARVNGDLCSLELKPILPADVYSPLEAAGFEPLREAVKALYGKWL